jgi:hypothetical protein
MSGVLLACAIAGSKQQQIEQPSGHMYLVVQYIDEDGAGVVALRHDDTGRLVEILPNATGWVNVRADSYAQAMQLALRKGLRTDGQ